MVKKIAGFLHLWLGFAAGLVLVLSLLPASLFVFDKELTAWWYHNKVFVNESHGVALPVSILLQNAQKEIGNTKPIQGIEISNDPNKTYIFSTYKAGKTKGITFFSESEYDLQAYVNPYTGKVQGVIDMRYNWIYLCRVMHQQMLLRYDIGHWFIGVSSIIIIISLITGFILWFPKSKAALKQRFTIKWSARWRRKNYDIHNVGGFYSLLLVLVLAATGLVWSFEWWSNGVTRLMGDDPKAQAIIQKISIQPLNQVNVNPLHNAFINVRNKHSSWTNLYISLPNNEAHGVPMFFIFLNFNDHTGWDESDSYTYNAVSGSLAQQELQGHRSIAAKMRYSNYSIHTGSIYGLPTKILACLGTLFCASLPVTGFLIWLGRKKKKPKPAVKKLKPPPKKAIVY